MADGNPEITFVSATPVPAWHFDFIEGDIARPMARLHGLKQGLAVSFVLHLILLSATAIVFVKTRDHGRCLSLTLSVVQDVAEIVRAELPVEVSTPSPIVVEGNAAESTEISSVADRPDESSPIAADGGRETLDAEVAEAGSVELSTRFSPKVVERLAKHSAARPGDYEVALYWEGKSDLDLHVLYESKSGHHQSTISHTNRGSPETGLLDVDQNYRSPYVEDPIEHVRWNTKYPPPGNYRIQVHGFLLRSPDGRPPKQVPFTVEVKTPEGFRSYSGAVSEGQSVEVDVLKIVFTPRIGEATPHKSIDELPVRRRGI